MLDTALPNGLCGFSILIMRHLKRFDQLEQKATAVMAGRRYPFLSLATVLYGGSLLYGATIRTRQWLYAHGVPAVHRVNCMVIAVGNLTAGGTGKTPMVIHLAQWLDSIGLRPVIVSRGYKGLHENTGAVVSDGRTLLCGAHAAGDEPYLMARLLGHVPVVVGKNRLAAARFAMRRFAPDVILLDDAFQHQRLARDINLLLLDGDAPLGNGYLLPRGPLREPVAALRRADAIIFTRSSQPPSAEQRVLTRMVHPRPVFHTRHVPVLRGRIPAMQPLHGADPLAAPTPPANILQDRPVFAFAALARNDTFWTTVAELGARIQGTMGFADHHCYCQKDIDLLIQAARLPGCRTLVTTDKDFVRLPDIALPMDLVVLGVEINFGDDTDRWRQFIAERLQQATCIDNQRVTLKDRHAG